MSGGWPRVLAWSLAAGWAALVGLGLALALRHGVGASDGPLFGPLTAGYAVGGMLVALRQPRNPIGWIMLVLALAFVASGVASGYVEPESDPRALFAGDAALVYYTASEAVWIPLVGILLPLLFPDGRLPSPRWRPVLWLAVAAIAIGLAGKIFAPGLVDPDEWPGLENPLAVEGAAGRAFEAAGLVAMLLFLPCVVAAAASVVVRFRRARGAERQQVKWFALAGAVLGVALFVAGLAAAAEQAGATETRWAFLVGATGWLTGLAVILIGFPVAVGVAVLRYRLYDVDVVINRTLVYGSMTAILAATYVGLVLLFQLVLRPVTADNGLAVALSTLAVAALFRPARSRIQHAVDRRFYRRKYDAERTLADFSARLRDEVDLETLATDLTGVVRDTVEPAHVSLWLRGAPR